MKPQRRVYKGGRAHPGWRRGSRLRSLKQLRKGTRIICVSHQFKAENLAIIIDRYPHRRIGIPVDNIVHATWTEGRQGRRPSWGGDAFAIWNHDLRMHHDSYFLAERERA